MVKRAARGAGDITLKYFDGLEDMGITHKADDSPVTTADREAEEFITRALMEIAPGIPVIGEEAVAAGTAPALDGAAYFWLVDALDGTREFIHGGGDYTVNIALIHDGQPVIGVVFSPVLGELYAGHGPETALRWLEETGSEKPCRVRRTPKAGLTVMASKNHGDAGRLDKFLENFKVERRMKRGSSLKICAIAAGKADIYPRFGPTCEWDTAAAHAVLIAAGGQVVDLAGAPLTYGKGDPKWLNPEFVASAFPWHEIEPA
ncbi:MAG: 3'(2'),5'-bisphosphate nucleotidase CysQ [Alphaproteobacteria bacterium]|nr:3'(2'),5'-bisphosphate nucleotidase CysQ [Alphaproteobacteria bacterium]